MQRLVNPIRPGYAAPAGQVGRIEQHAPLTVQRTAGTHARAQHAAALRHIQRHGAHAFHGLGLRIGRGDFTPFKHTRGTGLLHTRAYRAFGAADIKPHPAVHKDAPFLSPMSIIQPPSYLRLPISSRRRPRSSVSLRLMKSPGRRRGTIQACAAAAHGKQAAALAVDDHAALPAQHAAEGGSGIVSAHVHPLLPARTVRAEKGQATAGIGAQALAREPDDVGMIKIVPFLAEGVVAAHVQQQPQLGHRADLPAGNAVQIAIEHTGIAAGRSNIRP